MVNKLKASLSNLKSKAKEILPKAAKTAISLTPPGQAYNAYQNSPTAQNIAQRYAKYPQKMGRAVGQAVTSPYNLILQNKQQQTLDRVGQTLQDRSRRQMQAGELDASRHTSDLLSSMRERQASQIEDFGQETSQARKDAITGTLGTGLQLLGAKGMTGTKFLTGAGTVGTLGYGMSRLGGKGHKEALGDMGSSIGGYLPFAGAGNIARFATNPLLAKTPGLSQFANKEITKTLSDFGGTGLQKIFKSGGLQALNSALTTPARTALFSTLDSLENEKDFTGTFKDRFVSDLVFNTLYGGITGMAGEATQQYNQYKNLTKDQQKLIDKIGNKLGLDPKQPHTDREWKKAYREWAFSAHPDKGGSEQEFKEVQSAIDKLARDFQIDLTSVKTGDQISFDPTSDQSFWQYLTDQETTQEPVQNLISDISSSKQLTETPIESVVQVVNHETGSQEFYTVPQNKLQEVADLIDNQTRLAGTPIDGKTWHVTAGSPREMIEQGFTPKGEINIDDIPKLEKDLARVPTGVVFEKPKPEQPPVGSKLSNIQDDLVQEARKYDSAEEFVKAQPNTWYHGSTSDIKKFDDSITTPTFLTKDKNYADIYTYSKDASNKKGSVLEVQYKPKNTFNTSNPKDLDVYNNQFLPWVKSFSKDERYVPLKSGEKVPFTTADRLYNFLRGQKSRGNLNYDSILVNEGKIGGDALVPLSASQIQTKSQLTDIWNKAKGVEAPVGEVARLPEENQKKTQLELIKQIIEKEQEIRKAEGIKEPTNTEKLMQKMLDKREDPELDRDKLLDKLNDLEMRTRRLRYGSLIGFDELPPEDFVRMPGQDFLESGFARTPQGMGELPDRDYMNQEMVKIAKTRKEPGGDPRSFLEAGFARTSARSGLEQTINSRIEKFKVAPDTAEKVEVTNNLARDLKAVKNKIIEKIDRKGVSYEEVFDDLEAGGIQHPEIAEDYFNFMNSLRKKVVETGTDVGFIENYVPHYDLTKEEYSLIKEYEDGLWMSVADAKMGSFTKPRTYSLESPSKDLNKVMDHYIDQFVSNIFVQNLVPDDPIEKATLEYFEKIRTAMQDPNKRVRDLGSPNIINAGKKDPDKIINYKIETGIPTKLDLPGFALDHFNKFKRFGSDELLDKYHKWRDITTKFREEVDGEWFTLDWHRRNHLEKEITQDLIETLSEYNYEHTATEAWVDDFIGKELLQPYVDERTKFEKGLDLANQASSLGISGFWNPSSALNSLARNLRLFSYFKPQEVAQGISKHLSKDEMTRIKNKYAIDEFQRDFYRKIYDESKAEEDFSIAKDSGKLKGEWFEVDKEVIQELADSVEVITKGPRKLVNLNTLTSKDYSKLVQKGAYFYLAKLQEFKLYNIASTAEIAGKNKGLEGDDLVRYVRDTIFELGEPYSFKNMADVFQTPEGRFSLKWSRHPFMTWGTILEKIDSGQLRHALGMLAADLTGYLMVAWALGRTGRGLINQLQRILPVAFANPHFLMAKAVMDSAIDDTKTIKDMAITGAKTYIPGGSAGIRGYEGITTASQGYDQTSTGLVRAYGEPGGLGRITQGAFFGKYLLPDVQRYYKEDMTHMGERQSEVFLRGEEPDWEFARAREERLAGDREEAAFKETLELEKSTSLDELDIIKAKRAEEMPLTDEEKLTWATRKLSETPDADASKFQWAKWEKEKWSAIGDVLKDDELDIQEQVMIGERLGVSSEDMLYFDIAKETNDLKYIWIEEGIKDIMSTSNDRQDMLEFLVDNRKEVGGRMILAQTMVDDLYKAGYITKAERNYIKKFRWGEGVEPEVDVTGRGSGARLKKISVSAPSIPKARLSKSESPYIETQLDIPTMSEQAPVLSEARVAAPQLDPVRLDYEQYQDLSGFARI